MATVTDRGPWIKGRDLDVSEAVAIKLGMKKAGLATVRVQLIDGTLLMNSAECKMTISTMTLHDCKLHKGKTLTDAMQELYTLFIGNSEDGDDGADE